MVRSFFACVPLIVIVFTACTFTKESAVTRVPGYEMETFKVTSPGNCEGSDSCAVFEINYPVFTGLDSAVAKKIQREIELTFSMGDPEADEKSIRQIADEFIANFKTFIREIPEFGQAWYYHGDARVNVLQDSLISLSLDEEYYTGGAHGGSGKYFLNIHPATGKELTLDDFFKPGYEAALNREGEVIFRQERKLADSASFQFNYFEFPDNKFALNRNFGFTHEGIIFYFNNYEIAPYAAGPTEIMIPFDKLKGWLKSEPAL